MDVSLQQLLHELEIFGRDNDAREEDRSKKMLNIEPDTAHLISILIRSSHSKSLLEIGTSNGYSTIWLAWATQSTGGHVTSLERDPDKQVLADANLKQAGLRDRVDLLVGEATELISTLAGPFDFVLFDADRTSAPDQLRLLLPKLLPGSLVLADNALSHPDQIAPYLAAIEALPEMDHMVVPVGKGLSVAYKMAGGKSR
ncbi:MAG: class I SAM-dependent methyltransferase [Chloroflexi bacterium]|nr:class I SAM-dependent methyltransferase [Chloroflexota bacterium]